MIDILIWMVVGFALGKVHGYIQNRSQYNGRLIIRLKTKRIGGMKFRFSAKSMSENSIWIKSIDFSNNASIIFDHPIFTEGDTCITSCDMPDNSVGDIVISKIDAKILIEDGWRECFIVTRSVKENEIDLEFFEVTDND